MEQTQRKSGIGQIGNIPWGTHFCQFFSTGQDLLDISVPYLEAGMRSGEYCIWIVADPLDPEQVKSELTGRIGDIDSYAGGGRLEVISYDKWCLENGEFTAADALSFFSEKLNKAADEGYQGLRASIGLPRLNRQDWYQYIRFEEEINKVIGNSRMLLQCSFSLDACRAGEILDAVKNHRYVLLKRDGEWNVDTSPEMLKHEKVFEESEHRYRTLFERTSNPILVIDTEGNYLNGNSAALRFLEVSRDELLTMNIRDTFPPGRDDEKNSRIHREFWEKGGTIETDYLVKGKIKTLELTVTPGIWQQKPVVFGIGTDITEPRKIESQLRESETKFSVAFHSSPDIIAITTVKEGRYIDINDNYTLLTGYSRKELIGRRTVDVGIWANEKDRDRMIGLLEKQGKVAGEEFGFRIKSGEIRNWRFSAERVDLNGEDCLIFSAVDITEQKKNRQLLNSENQVLRLLGQPVELEEILDAIARLGEEYEPGTRVSVMLYNPVNRMLYLAAAPGLPEEYRRMLESGLPVEPDMGLCGTAAFLKERVVVADIAGSLLIPDAKVVVNMGLLAGVSQPVISSTGELLGTIANYFGKKGSPGPDSLKVLEWSAGIAAIAIERKKAETALKESEERFRTMVNAMEEIIFTLDTGMRHTGVYGPWVSKFGLTPEYFLGRTAVDIFGKEAARAHEEANRKALSGEFVIYEWQAPVESGGVHIQTSLSPIRDREGNITGIVGIGRDITDRIQFEQALSLRALLLDSAGDGICLLSKDGNFVYVNEMYCRYHGFSRDELLGMNIRSLDTHFTDERFDRVIQQLEEKRFALFEATHTRKDGSEIELEVFSRVIESGGELFNLGIERDITERNRTMRTLRESEEFSTSLLKNSPNPILVVNPDTSIRYVNPALEKISGYSSEELRKMKAPYPYWGEQNSEQDIERWKRHISLGIEGFEIRMTRKNGEHFWVRASNAPVKTGGKLEYTITNWVDITETRRTEEALRESEEKYRTLFRNAPIGITISTEEGEIIDANTALLNIHGYDSLDEFRQVPISKRYLDPEERQRWLDILNSRGKVTNFEAQCLRKDGSVFWALLNSISQTPASAGKVNIVAVQDITEHKQAEIALQANEEKYRTLVNNINLGISRSTPDPDGRFLEVNHAMEAITGYSREELLDLKIIDLYQDPRERAATLRELESGRKQVSKEVQFRRKDGGVITVLDVKVPVNGNSGELLYFDGILEDITLKKAFEEERQKIEKLESLGVLAGGIAHDFNNLLTGIMGNISLAMMDIDKNSETYICLQEADSASERARDLTQQLLTFSRGGAPVKTLTGPGSLIRETTDFLLRGSRITAEYSISGDLWMVEADKGQISQVISNIVINARDAMPGGGTLKAKASNKTVAGEDNIPLNPGNYVELIFTDTGTGIQEKFLQKIFEPYFTTKQKGSGLGLATSYSIIKKHNGLITVESELGVGTAFTVYLPASDKTAEVKKEEKEEPPEAGSRGKILVMDDEPDIRLLLGRMLSGIGYTVETVKDGTEAVDVYTRAMEEGQAFDAVILDITVPGGMGGIETIGKLVEIDPGINAIVSSGYSTDPVMSEYEKYGFKAVVNKPYRADRMKNTLHDLLAGE